MEGGQYTVHTPLMALGKDDIVRQGAQLGVDYAQTVSCYRATDAGLTCARCDAIDSVSCPWGRIRRPARWIILCRRVLSCSNSHSAGRFCCVERFGARVIICSSRARL